MAYATETRKSSTSLLRIKKDVSRILADNIPGITISPSNENLEMLFALIIGPKETPYEDGFFLFKIVFPSDYPNSPPDVKILNTENGRVRFGPNLYANGKVCLSILNTWDGPKWTPALNLSSVLLSIQSLMSAQPYFNEPGYTKERRTGDSEQYNRIIAHETLRCAVCDILERTLPIPDNLYAVALSEFRKNYDLYIARCQSNLGLSSSSMVDPFGGIRGTFQYVAILRRLQALKK